MKEELLCNFIEIILRHECSPVNLLHIFRIPFPKNTFGGMLLDFYVKVKSQTKIGRQMDTDRETHNIFTDFTRRYEVPQNTVIERSRRRKYIQKLYNMIYWKYAYGNIHMISIWKSAYYVYCNFEVHCSPFFLQFSILNLKILFLNLEVVIKFNSLHDESNWKSIRYLACGLRIPLSTTKRNLAHTFWDPNSRPFDSWRQI